MESVDGRLRVQIHSQIQSLPGIEIQPLNGSTFLKEWKTCQKSQNNKSN